ncbi:glycoside hydrolase [Ophiobolus disseminans]|uniref:glucan 1,3-beta-glucosidase n=1 Tax=Ophiobolus disseminans TaxID=1469910 RepID=A0A6A6ZXD5_9PLEO|nr:glycoside hydrolase [Ophiobolus disseminans]
MGSDSDRDPSRRRPHGEERRRRRESHGDLDPERRRRRESRGEHTPYEHDNRRRKGHRATDSQGDLLPRPPRQSRQQSDSEQHSPSPRKTRPARRNSTTDGSGSRSRGSAQLSLDAIAKLDKVNAKKAGGWGQYDYDDEYLREVRRKEKNLEKGRVKEERAEKKKEKREEENHRRANESDAAILEEKARKRREERRKARESAKPKTDEELEKRRGARTRTDDELEKRRSARPRTDDELEKRRSARPRTDDEQEKKRSAHTEDEREERRLKYEAKYTPSEIDEKKERRRQEKQRRMEQKKRRVISGPLAEEGGVDDDEYQYMMEKRGGGAPTVYSSEQLAKRKKWKRIAIIVASILILLAIIIPVAVMMSNKSNGGDNSSGNAAAGASPKTSNLDGHDRNSVPKEDQGGIYDPWAWFDTDDFNVTYTKETVGGLPIIGLNSTWEDDVQANPKVPNLKDKFAYGKTPIRGVNVGGWLNLEPFITPSFFEGFGSKDGVVDEWTLLTKLGPTKARDTMEKHYSAFITKKTFSDIRAAGMDHVRFPFGYWIVQTFGDEPYIPQISWRYLLRGIEYCRQNGLRVNLDLHGAPGSQNGWNHSGRQGVIGWLNGTDGDLNAQRTLDIHHKLSVFFAQPRYKNLVTMYGLVNEPRNVELDTQKVVAWTQKAITQIRADNITAIIVFGDGFMGLDNWQGKLQNNENLLLDVHQYVTFNIDQLSLKHRDKLNFACEAWTQQSKRSMDKTTGFGPTMCGEWSQADTDCTTFINNVATGTRWEGTFNTGNLSTSVLVPQCPLKSNQCSCSKANGDPSGYSEQYKKWLYQFAIAQMDSFEAGWGWFYWTWETERATQWSYRRGIEAGILPKKAYDRDWKCPKEGKDLDMFTGLEEYY